MASKRPPGREAPYPDLPALGLRLPGPATLSDGTAVTLRTVLERTAVVELGGQRRLIRHAEVSVEVGGRLIPLATVVPSAKRVAPPRSTTWSFRW